MNLNSPKKRGAVFAPGFPLAYLITFTTYGTRLHGDPRGSVNREHNRHQEPCLQQNAQIQNWQTGTLKVPPLKLDRAGRLAVHEAIEAVLDNNSWELRALNVRTNHVHVVIAADTEPEPIMNSLKSWATRRLKCAGVNRPNGTYWTRHGSTEYLWTPDAVSAACRYVIENQGEDLI
jgi:REP element-mobilizing transposase RayT